jgi:hypothetical protein
VRYLSIPLVEGCVEMNGIFVVVFFDAVEGNSETESRVTIIPYIIGVCYVAIHLIDTLKILGFVVVFYVMNMEWYI